MDNNTHMEGNLTNENLQQPALQWEAPVLYTEQWLQTLGGGVTDIIENGLYHT